MKGIFFSNYNLKDESSGVSKKIQMQIDAFKQNGVNIESPAVFADSKMAKVYIKLPLSSSIYDYNISRLIKKIDNKGLDFIYFRHNIFTRKLFKNIKKLKEKGITILYEIPTYPYDRNEHKLKNTFMRIKDKKWRKKCGVLIDYIIDYSGTKEIYGAKTINICNGINPDFISPKIKFSKKEDIHLIAVALISPVHGFDRVIRALREYYRKNPKTEVYFHIIGDGDARQELQKLTKKLNLNKYVIFYGKKYGKELDNIYNIADIGIGVLGIHRRYQNQKVSSLKTKEYCAKGIPFVSAEYDDAFEKYKCDFKYMVEQNDDTFDISDLIMWYKNLTLKYYDKIGLSTHIRKYSYDHLTWKDQIAKIVNILS